MEVTMIARCIKILTAAAAPVGSLPKKPDRHLLLLTLLMELKLHFFPWALFQPEFENLNLEFDRNTAIELASYFVQRRRADKAMVGQ